MGYHEKRPTISHFFSPAIFRLACTAPLKTNVLQSNCGRRSQVSIPSSTLVLLIAKQEVDMIIFMDLHVPRPGLPTKWELGQVQI